MADAVGSEPAGRKAVEVRVLPRAPIIPVSCIAVCTLGFEPRGRGSTPRAGANSGGPDASQERLAQAQANRAARAWRLHRVRGAVRTIQEVLRLPRRSIGDCEEVLSTANNGEGPTGRGRGPLSRRCASSCRFETCPLRHIENFGLSSRARRFYNSRQFEEKARSLSGRPRASQREPVISRICWPSVRAVSRFYTCLQSSLPTFPRVAQHAGKGSYRSPSKPIPVGAVHSRRRGCGWPERGLRRCKPVEESGLSR